MLAGRLRLREKAMKIDGGCHCGAIRYEAEIDPEKVGICNCQDCQQLSASAFRTIVLVESENFHILSGRPKVYVKTADSGNEREQTFCETCGSALYSTSVGEDPKIYSIRVGTARQRAEMTPRFQIWTRSALPWLKDIAGIPAKEKQ
jgi:hypothetical protein